MKPKYKVLHLVESLDAVGGLEKIAAEIVGNLDKDEFEAEIWCVHRGGRMADQLTKQGLKVRVLGISTYHNPLNVLKLAGLFREAKPDIVHTHVYFASTIGRVAGKLAGVKVLINHVHSTYWHYHWGNLFIEWLLSKITNKIICVSNKVRDFVIDHERIDNSRVQVVYNGISVDRGLSRDQARREFKVNDQEIIITCVANLLENKGHKILLQAFSLIAERNPNVKCWLVGEGPMEAELKEYAQQLKISPKVIFWGERNNVPQFLLASDIFVLPSIQREGLAVSVIEAMAYKVAVIVTHVGGLPELIDDQKSGLIVAPGNAADLKSAMEGLMTDRQRRHDLAQEAEKKFQKIFQAKMMVTRIEEIYKENLK